MSLIYPTFSKEIVELKIFIITLMILDERHAILLLRFTPKDKNSNGKWHATIKNYL